MEENKMRSPADILQFIEDKKLSFEVMSTMGSKVLRVHSGSIHYALYPMHGYSEQCKEIKKGYLAEAVSFVMDMEEREDVG